MSGATQSPTALGPTVREHGAIAALVLAFVALQRVLFDGDGLIGRLEVLLGGRLFVAGLYGLVTLGVLASAYLAYDRYVTAEPADMDPFELFRGGLAVALLVSAWTYAAAGPDRSGPLSPSLVESMLYAGGTVLLAVAYARLRDVDIPAALPSRRDWVAVAGGVAAVVGPVLALAALIGEPADFWGVSIVSTGPYGTFDPATFVEATLVPSLLTAVAVSVLFFGVVQEALAGYRGRAAAAGGATALAVLPQYGVWWTRREVAADPEAVVTVGVVAAVVGLVFLYGAVLDRARAATAMDPGSTALVGGAAVVGGCLVPGAVFAEAALGSSPTYGVVIAAFSFPVALSVGAVVYDRTETVLAPFAVIATSTVLLDVVAESQLLVDLL